MHCRQSSAFAFRPVIDRIHALRFAVFVLLLAAALFLRTPASAEEVQDQLLNGISPEEGVTQDVKTDLGSFSREASPPVLQTLGKLFQSAVSSSGILSVRTGLRTAAILLAAALAGGLPAQDSGIRRSVELACIVVVVSACAGDLHAMIGLGTDTVEKIGHYALALIPGLCALMAAAGGMGTGAAVQVAASGALNLFCSLCARLLVPLIYLFLGLSAAEAALGLGTLDKLRDLVKWLCTSILKWTVTLFTGLLALIGCFTGSADASKLKAARLVISGMIPMVGGAVSGASESILNAAQTLKSAVGAYGMLAVLGMFMAPFLKIAAQYLILKTAGAMCGLIGSSPLNGLISRMTEAMGLVLAMTGVACMMTLLSFALCVKTVSA